MMNLQSHKTSSFSKVINEALFGQFLSGMVGVSIGLFLGSYFGLL
ncbi:hypothetical protein PCC8801_2178 [Rippkaea orientalis PCC 8801]|uniref:Uncharacterized protein n=1 Tax=Rippkaea orientalis (strain PCC 8801 / RF-1) TaxID=41431 RepID=B7K059_RIPO1|nr:hypothetical protein PCC8801_2178 [Rippkaea orientalis PCC 8801]